MRSVAPTNAMFRRSSRSLQISFVMITVGIFLGVVGLGLFVFPVVTDASQSAGLFKIARGIILFGGIALGVVGLLIAIRAVTLRKENDPARTTADALKAHFDDSYTFIRNINKRPIGYIDAALVGPPGVLIFRVLDWKGTYLGEGRGWMKPGRGGEWVVTTFNPTKQVVDDIRNVRDYFAEYGLTDVPTFGIIVFIHDDATLKLMLKDPVVPATHLNSLYNRLHEHYLATTMRIDSKTVKDAVDLLYDR